MKRWAIIVAGLYSLILIVLTVPAIMLAFYGGTKSAVSLKDAAGVYASAVYWAWLAVMVLSQVALLAVPVRMAAGRPVPRRALLPTVLASGLMMAGLAAGAICALYEFASKLEENINLWLVAGIMALTWCLWSLIFMRLGRTLAPTDLVSRQCRRLLGGSILELLVAVPTHIVARNRDYCCAGVMTFVGLVMGMSVMLFSFGPAVFFLFAARWKRLHPT